MAARLGTVVAMLGAAAASSAAAGGSRRYDEHVLRVPVRSPERVDMIDVTVFRPEGSGPFPIVVPSHGSPRRMYAALIAGGGRAEYRAAPRLEGDGHGYFAREVEDRAPVVGAFLKRTGDEATLRGARHADKAH